MAELFKWHWLAHRSRASMSVSPYTNPSNTPTSSAQPQMRLYSGPGGVWPPPAAPPLWAFPSPVPTQYEPAPRLPYSVAYKLPPSRYPKHDCNEGMPLAVSRERTPRNSPRFVAVCSFAMAQRLLNVCVAKSRRQRPPQLGHIPEGALMAEPDGRGDQ